MNSLESNNSSSKTSAYLASSPSHINSKNNIFTLKKENPIEINPIKIKTCQDLNNISNKDIPQIFVNNETLNSEQNSKAVYARKKSIVINLSETEKNNLKNKKIETQIKTNNNEQIIKWSINKKDKKYLNLPQKQKESKYKGKY